MKKLVVAIIALLLVPLVQAHHSFFGRFDTGDSMQLEGTVTRVLWRNPHAHITLEVEEDGVVTEWDLESGSPTLMYRAGIPNDAIQEGQYIRVAAYPPLTSKKEAFATNILLPGGEELVLQTGASAKFNQQVTGDFSYRFRTQGDRSRPELGLFRVWTFTGAGENAFLFPESINRAYDLNNYPMTEAAKTAVANFNPATDNPTNNCTPKGMPLIMEQPLPMEILQEGENIVFRLEEYDLRRIIHMNETQVPESIPHTPLGYSIGHWENETLVVTTSHINWPHFNQAGIPQSEQSVLTERFTMVEEGSEMDYELVVNDPINFAEPVQLVKTWLYIPDENILPFECTLSE